MWSQEQLYFLEQQKKEREERAEFMREGARILKENPDMSIYDLPSFYDCKNNNYDCDKCEYRYTCKDKRNRRV